MPSQLNLIPDPPGIFDYWNTPGLKGQDLKKAKLRAGTQAYRILTFFKAHRGQLFTPAEIQERLSMKVLTSVRRAMTNLTDQGYLRKTDTQRPGKYGDLNYCWVRD